MKTKIHSIDNNQKYAQIIIEKGKIIKYDKANMHFNLIIVKDVRA